MHMVTYLLKQTCTHLVIIFHVIVVDLISLLVNLELTERQTQSAQESLESKQGINTDLC